MAVPKILVTEPIPEAVLAFLASFAQVSIGEKGRYMHEDALITDLSEVDALLCMLSTPVSRNVLQSAPLLKVVANFAVGYNNIDVEAANALGIKVANTPDVLTEACGDFAMALLLATTRRFFDAENYLRSGKFKGWEPLGFLGMELGGKKLGIIGMGRIGRAFAQRARAFGMHIYYSNRTQLQTELEQPLNATFVEDYRELAAISDVLSLNCPLTMETRHLANAALFKTMPRHAILINISRGSVADEAALAEALHSGEIAGAGLDVFENEPEVHPRLITAPNCTILPHIASATFETREAIGMLAASAIQKVLSGQADSNIPNLVSS
jgi:glyoxylate reductase